MFTKRRFGVRIGDAGMTMGLFWVPICCSVASAAATEPESMPVGKDGERDIVIRRRSDGLESICEIGGQSMVDEGESEGDCVETG